ncbi:MAG: beta strand repeat-containing protein, partial [Planctomycetaceae bacterium]
MRRSSFVSALASGLLLLAIAPRAVAIDVSWTAGTGAYDVGTNWSTGLVPSGTDVAVIANGGVATLTLSGSSAGAQLAVGRDGTGSLVVAGAGTHSVTGPAFIGYTAGTAADAVAGIGALTVGSGATLRIEGGVGNTLVGAGVGSVGGAGSITIASGAELVFVGDGSTRSLVIADTVNGNSSTASLDISGTLTVAAGEFVVAQGRASTAGGVGTASGTITLNAGGVLTTNNWTKFASDVFNGPRGGGTARLIVNGGTFNKLGNGALVFGNYDGTAIVTQSGGSVNVAGTSDGLFIGAWGVSGSGSYTLSSGTLSVSSKNLTIGKSNGQGTFTMTGGLVQKTSAEDFEIGDGGAAVGTMTVSGGLVDIQAGDLAIASYGATGSLTIGGAGVVRAGNVVFSKGGSSTLATLTLDAGGRLEAARISSANSAATTTLMTINGGTLAATANQPSFISGLAGLTLDAGGATIDTQAFSVTVPQPLIGSGALTKLGSGTLTMTGAGSYSGPTTVAAGGLGLTTAHTGGGAVTVAAGAGLGVAVAGAANTQLNLSSLSLGNGSTVTIDLASFGNPTLSPLNVAGALTTSGGSTVINVASGAPATGTVPLISYTTLNNYNFTLGTLPVGMQASLVNNSAANRIDLLVTSIPIRRWEGNVNAAWDTSSANWVATFSGPGPSAVFSNGDGPVLFTDEATGPTAVTLNTTVQPLATSFTNNVLPYSLTGTGTIGGTGGVTKSGSATVTIGTRNSYTGVTRLEGGTTSIAVLANGGAASGIGAAPAAASNLVFAGGRLEYTGSSVTINRGFSLTGDGGGISVTQTNALVSTSGTVTADSGRFVKGGPGHLRLTGTANALGRVSESAGLIVESGSLQLCGLVQTPPAQITTVPGEVPIGGVADAAASLAMTNSTLNATGWLSLGHETGTANSTTTLLRAAVNASDLRMGYSALLNSGSHALTLDNSTVSVTGQALIGNINPSVATVLLQGTSAFRVGTTMNIANLPGTVGTVTMSNTTTLTVLGQLRVGDLGAGSLTATGSARLLLNDLQLAQGPVATGTMTMGTDSSAVLTGYVAVGNSGNGALAMSGRSRMSVQYDLNVADLGGSTGTLTMADRAAASGASLYLGKGAASTGQVTISGGTLSQTNAAGEFIVGREGAGVLTISGSGRVLASATSGLVLASGSTATQGLVNLNGGTLEVTRISRGSGTGAGLVLNGGTLRAAVNANADFLSGLDTADVQAGGARIDTNGQSVGVAQVLTG